MDSSSLEEVKQDLKDEFQKHESSYQDNGSDNVYQNQENNEIENSGPENVENENSEISNRYDDYQSAESYNGIQNEMENYLKKASSFSHLPPTLTDNSSFPMDDDIIPHAVSASGTTTPVPGPSSSSSFFPSALSPLAHQSSIKSNPPPSEETSHSPFYRQNSQPLELEDEVFQLISVLIYSTSTSNVLKVNRTITGRDICRALEKRCQLTKEESKFHCLVCIITVFDSMKRSKVHCIRTIANEEIVLNILDLLINKLMIRYNIMDFQKLKNSTRWIYKDVRTSPILLEDYNYATFDTTGEDEISDDEEELSHSDLNYLVKSERKGYLLKRSSKDINLWKKWYCVLTDHLYCININQVIPKSICIKLNGVQRARSNHIHSEQVTNIIINSTRGSHLLRAFNILDQKKWIEDLHLRSQYSTDNDLFNMAEVIICDEEYCKNKKATKIIEEYLSSPCILQAIGLNYYSYYHIEECPPLTAIRSDMFSIIASENGEEEEEEEREQKEGENSFWNDDGQLLSTTVSQPTDSWKEGRDEEDKEIEIADFEDSEEEEEDEEQEKEEREREDNEGEIEENQSENDRTPKKKTRSRKKKEGDYKYNNSLLGKDHVKEGNGNVIVKNENQQIHKPHETTDLLIEEDDIIYKALNPLDRTISSFMIHSLHTQYHNYYNILKFILEVLQYKELFRIDLFASSKTQRVIANNIFINYLIPQITNDENKELIVFKVIALPEKMKKNGISGSPYFPTPPSLPVSSSSSIVSTSAIKRPASQSKLRSNDNRAVSPKSAPANSSQASSSHITPVKLKNEDNRVTPQSQPFLTPATAIAAAAITTTSGSLPISEIASVIDHPRRFPVYNAVKSRYQQRRMLSVDLEERKAFLGGPSSTSSLVRRESGTMLYENNFYWGINEEQIMKIFLKLFPPDPPSSVKTPTSNSTSIQSVDDLSSISANAATTRSTHYFTRQKSNTALTAVTTTTTPTINSSGNSGSWFWWGSSTSTGNAAKPPSIANPTVRPSPPDAYRENSLNDIQSQPAVTAELFDEIVDEVLLILREKQVYD
jgi:hypothetical protein